MTSSTKKYSLRSGQDILNIPDKFDETLLQDVKDLSTETALAKRSTNNSTGKSSTKDKSSTKSAKSTSSNSVSEGTRGKNKQTSGIVTRSSTSSNKGSSKGSGKGFSTASSKGSSKVREEWYDETIFDNKRIKHEVKVKKESPSEDSIFCLKCNETFDSIEDLNAHLKNKCYTKYSYKCLDMKCTKTFSQKSNMQQHYYTVHLGKPFKCQYCDSYFTYIKTHTKHEKAQYKDKLSKSVTFKYSCADCTYKTNDKTEYTSHVDERSQNTILLASTQAVYKAPHSTVRGQSVVIIRAEAVATVVVGVSEHSGLHRERLQRRRSVRNLHHGATGKGTTQKLDTRKKTAGKVQ